MSKLPTYEELCDNQELCEYCEARGCWCEGSWCEQAYDMYVDSVYGMTVDQYEIAKNVVWENEEDF